MPETTEWTYCRIGIPGEGFSGTEEAMKQYAQDEVSRGYGLDPADIFMIGPQGQLFIPADRSNGTGPVTWVAADEVFLAELARSDWDPADLEMVLR